MKNNILKKAVISEKAYRNMDHGIYTFLIEKAATKSDVISAVKKYFSVDAVKVNITPVSAKKKRINKTRKFADVGGGKKAIVWLKSGQSISALSAKTGSKSDKKDLKPKKIGEKSDKKEKK